MTLEGSIAPDTEPPVTRSQTEMVACGYCRALFVPKRLRQDFCEAKCRAAFAVDVGATGKVAGVRRLRRGISLTIHLDGPAGESAVNLKHGDLVRAVRRT